MRQLLILFLFIGTTCTVSAQEISLEQKTKRFYNAERDFLKIPVDRTVLREELMPEAYNQRSVLAPNFPTSFVDVYDRQNQVAEWIESYPQEYDDYVLYLEVTIRSFL